MHILLIEDDLSLQNGISFKLTKERYTVVCADTVAGAFALLENAHFHMAILDISLPDGSGLDICRRIRQSAPAVYVNLKTSQKATEI